MSRKFQFKYFTDLNPFPEFGWNTLSSSSGVVVSTASTTTAKFAPNTTTTSDTYIIPQKKFIFTEKNFEGINCRKKLLIYLLLS